MDYYKPIDAEKNNTCTLFSIGHGLIATVAPYPKLVDHLHYHFFQIKTKICPTKERLKNDLRIYWYVFIIK